MKDAITARVRLKAERPTTRSEYSEFLISEASSPDQPKYILEKFYDNIGKALVLAVRNIKPNSMQTLRMKIFTSPNSDMKLVLTAPMKSCSETPPASFYRVQKQYSFFQIP